MGRMVCNDNMARILRRLVTLASDNPPKANA